jgi:hypothetical protein
MKQSVFSLVQLLLLATAMTVQGQALVRFSTGGHTVYHLDVGTINGKRVTFSASYDGFVMCHDRYWYQLFKTDIGEGFPFDIAAGDIDGDGNDEATNMQDYPPGLYLLRIFNESDMATFKIIRR